MRYAKKVDLSQPAIVTELRAKGIQTIDMSSAGKSFPDLLCHGGSEWVLIELKETGDGCLSRGQLAFLATARGHVAVATDASEAEQIARHPHTHSLTRAEKMRIEGWLILNPKQGSLSVGKFRKVIEG